jgi:opacity protein-like surface antigen
METRLNRTSILAGLATALTLTPALADSTTGTDWTGFYAGGQIVWMDVEYPTSSPVVVGGIAFDGNGAGVGLHAGYNHDFGDFVLGAEVSLDFPSVDIELTPTGSPAPREIDRVTLIKAKAGYDAGRLLPHALIGYAWQVYDDTTGATSADQTFDGMTYGLGVDYLLSPSVIAGLEALWFDLDPESPASHLTSEGTSLSLRLSYRF